MGDAPAGKKQPCQDKSYQEDKGPRIIPAADGGGKP